MKYARHLRSLHNLTNEIGVHTEVDSRYFEIYDRLIEVLELAEELGLIVDSDDLTGDLN
jgi:hypothetical protein